MPLIDATPAATVLTNKIVFGNIEGLFPRRMKHKVSMLRERAELESVAFICLTESHLRQDIKDADISMGGFQMHRADRLQGIKKGGVVVHVRDDFSTHAKVLTSGFNGVVEWLVLYFRY